jgi:hypothetical protein
MFHVCVSSGRLAPAGVKSPSQVANQVKLFWEVFCGPNVLLYRLYTILFRLWGGADSDSSYPNQELYLANDTIPNQKKDTNENKRD